MISAHHNPIPTNGFQHMKCYLFLGTLTIWYSVNLKMKATHCEDTPKSTLAAQIGLYRGKNKGDKVGMVGKWGGI